MGKSQGSSPLTLLTSRVILTAGLMVALLCSCGTSRTVSFDATMAGTGEVDIVSRVNGVVKKIHAKEGSHMQQGQVLLVIDVPEADVRMRECQAKVNELEALKKASEEPDEALTARLAGAYASLAGAQMVRADAYAKAYIDGEVTALYVTLGQTVDQSTVLCRLSDTREMVTTIAVEERLLQKYFRINATDNSAEPLGQLTLRLADGSVYDQPGHVLSVGRAVDASGCVPVKIGFANPDKVIRSGSKCTVEILPLKTK